MVQRSHYIYALGVLFVLIAGGQFALKVADGGPLLEAAIDFVLVGFPGVLLLYVGRWLTSTTLDPGLYPRIALWCLGGVGVMFVFIILRAVHPGVSTPFSFGTRAIALSIGSVAGLGIGIHEARALTREREVSEKNENLKRVRRELEHRNDELDRTREQLERANRRLHESNEQLEQFAYAASHDLREPLRMVTMYLTLLENRYAEELDEDAEEFLEFAVDGATRMQTMIDDLLQYSRIDTQGEPFEPVDLGEVLEDVLDDLQVLIDETDAEITVTDHPVVVGDESQLRQLIQNLLANAIEYCGDEPPRVRIGAERRDDEWVVSVSDDGIGIDPDDQDRIFEIFQRLHSVDEHAGSGIGLALCQRIVERHDGEIWVDSAPGEGSTFSFTVPPTDVLSSSDAAIEQ
ncbi:sensor histidine kinase [Natronobacterium texcoconense]|uniref:histidine kinase n=1 Tax=Natronobacterium texcoconense TaxID=1095778 RepID=A0A1H1A9M8_NATTX|nr:ATP-binding protein [Natronobacterium texcoconense]SDQ36357.1 His Kinase A (phospho-acceptor) domain-containing protein [Natronobacterium texcoconense]